jgi:hypothetical protein
VEKRAQVAVVDGIEERFDMGVAPFGDTESAN